MKNQLSLLLLGAFLAVVPSLCLSQNSIETYEVNTREMTLRSGPGIEYPVILKLKRSDIIEVKSKTNIQWWEVQSANGQRAFAYQKFLKRVAYQKLEDQKKWQPAPLPSGQVNCENHPNLKDKNLQNHLRIEVQRDYDVLVKIVDINLNESIRTVYIPAQTTYTIRNIPQGQYRIKMAQGKNLMTLREDNCVYKFKTDGRYLKASGILDFTASVITEAAGPNNRRTITQYPNHEIKLYTTHTIISGGNFGLHSISEGEFNF